MKNIYAIAFMTFLIFYFFHPAFSAISPQSLPSADDLAETSEVQFTQAIRDQAQTLGTPIGIYNWVRNTIEFVPTFASVQGANYTLESQRGNAFDTASLLIALLRAANIPARYAYGTVEIPAAEFSAWIGIADPQLAADLLTQAGAAVTLLTAGGKVQAVRLEHIWVEAWIDMVPSGGVVQRNGDSWVPLDASFKPKVFSNSFDWQNFLTTADIDQLVQQANTADTDPNTLDAIDVTVIEPFLTQKGSEAVQQNQGNFLRQESIATADLGRFGYGLPYRLVTTQQRFSAIPENLQQRLTVNFYRSPRDQVLASPDFSHSFALAELSDQRLSLGFDPASQADADRLIETLNNQQAIVPSQYSVVPHLYLEEQIVKSGSAMPYGQAVVVEVVLTSPNLPTDRGDTVLDSGAYAAIVPNYYSTSLLGLQRLQDRQEVVYNQIQNDDFSNYSRGITLGDFLWLTGQYYWFETNRLAPVLNQLNGSQVQPLTGVGIFAATVKITENFGVPVRMEAGDWLTDINIARNATVGDAVSAVSLQALLGLSTSYWEAAIWDLRINGDLTQTNISSVTIIDTANQSGIPIYQLDKNNINALLPTFTIDEAAKQDIQNVVNAGFNVVVPHTAVSIGNWQGIGYYVLDPKTGSGVYRINGGFNGGAQELVELGLEYASVAEDIVQLATLGGNILNGTVLDGIKSVLSYMLAETISQDVDVAEDIAELEKCLSGTAKESFATGLSALSALEQMLGYLAFAGPAGAALSVYTSLAFSAANVILVAQATRFIRIEQATGGCP